MWWILFSNTATSKTVLLTQTCQTEPQLENAVSSNELFLIVDLYQLKNFHELFNDDFWKLDWTYKTEYWGPVSIFVMTLHLL